MKKTLLTGLATGLFLFGMVTMANTAPMNQYVINVIDYSSQYSDINSVPEPATMLLFGLGLLGLARLSRKKK